MTLRYHKIGIIGALDEEVDELIKNLIPNTMSMIPSEKFELDTCFHSGQIGAQEVVVVKCGVGKVNAAIVTQRLIDTYGCDAVMKVGVAGGIADEVKKNDVVIATEIMEHDMEAFEGPGIIPNMKTSKFVADRLLVEIAKAACEKVCGAGNFHAGMHASGDQFICTDEKKQWLKDTFNPLCAEMEGGGLAHACVVNHVPYLVLSSISDGADNNAVQAFEQNKDEAVDFTTNVVIEMLR